MKVSRIVVLIAMALLVSMPAMADLKKGDKEVTASFSYSTQDFDDSELELTDTQLDVDFGYLLTDRHEIGGRLQWFKTEVEPFGFDADGTTLGVFYHFNFNLGGAPTPFAGAFYSTIGGDEGDIVDSSYGIEGGVKIYPWENGGFILKAVWNQFTGADGNSDGDGLGFFGGVGLKW